MVAALDRQPIARRDPAMEIAPERVKAVEKTKIATLNWLTPGRILDFRDA
jgi:hypothetical protein